MDHSEACAVSFEDNQAGWWLLGIDLRHCFQISGYRHGHYGGRPIREVDLEWLILGNNP